MKPIIMSTEDVRALLDGRKTMMRQVMKPQPVRNGAFWELGGAGWSGNTVTPVYGHSLQHACIGIVQLVELCRHPFGLAADHRTVGQRVAIGGLQPLQPPVDLLDGVDLTADTLQLEFVEGVEARQCAVQAHHLFVIFLGMTGQVRGYRR